MNESNVLCEIMVRRMSWMEIIQALIKPTTFRVPGWPIIQLSHRLALLHLNQLLFVKDKMNKGGPSVGYGQAEEILIKVMIRKLSCGRL